MNTPASRYPYAGNRADLSSGITFATLDPALFPASLVEANEAIQQALHAEVLADTKVAQLTQVIQQAEKQDELELGRAMADGAKDPGSPNTTKARAALDDATRHAKASRHATAIIRARFLRELEAADRVEIAKALHAQAEAQIEAASASLAQAQLDRDAAHQRISLARMMDAYPMRHNDWFSTAFGASDAWRHARQHLGEDLDELRAAAPMSVLADRPDLLPGQVVVTKSEGRFNASR